MSGFGGQPRRAAFVRSAVFACAALLVRLATAPPLPAQSVDFEALDQ